MQAAQGLIEQSMGLRPDKAVSSILSLFELGKFPSKGQEIMLSCIDLHGQAPGLVQCWLSAFFGVWEPMILLLPPTEGYNASAESQMQRN